MGRRRERPVYRHYLLSPCGHTIGLGKDVAPPTKRCPICKSKIVDVIPLPDPDSKGQMTWAV